MDYLSSSLRHISHGRCDGLILLWTLSPTWTSCQLYMSIFNQIILKLSTCHHPGLWQNLLRVGISENFRSKLTCQHLAFVKNSQVYTSVKDWFSLQMYGAQVTSHICCAFVNSMSHLLDMMCHILCSQCPTHCNVLPEGLNMRSDKNHASCRLTNKFLLIPVSDFNWSTGQLVSDFSWSSENSTLVIMPYNHLAAARQ